MTIKNYYEKRNITIKGELKKAIDSNNSGAIRLVCYSIENLHHVKGMPEALEQLALIQLKGNDSKRQFFNSLMELHAANFLAQVLNEDVVEIESRSHRIKSPFAQGEKCCDLKTINGNEEKYYEVKSVSSEITTQHTKNDVTCFDPMGNDKIEQWIKDKLKEADKCGANYLICNVPFWPDNSTETENFYKNWGEQIFQNFFKITKWITKNEIIVYPHFSLSSHVKGFYIIKTFGHIKVTIQK